MGKHSDKQKTLSIQCPPEIYVPKHRHNEREKSFSTTNSAIAQRRHRLRKKVADIRKISTKISETHDALMEKKCKLRKKERELRKDEEDFWSNYNEYLTEIHQMHSDRLRCEEDHLALAKEYRSLSQKSDGATEHEIKEYMMHYQEFKQSNAALSKKHQLMLDIGQQLQSFQDKISRSEKKLSLDREIFDKQNQIYMKARREFKEYHIKCICRFRLMSVMGDPMLSKDYVIPQKMPKRNPPTQIEDVYTTNVDSAAVFVRSNSVS